MSQPPNKAVIIGISGPSSSGKTTLARLLQTVFSGVQETLRTFIIHEDDFYFPDDRIPYTTTPSGETVQDWDCAAAIDVNFLSSALSYVRKEGALPPRLTSIQDLNEATESGVDGDTIDRLRGNVLNRLVAAAAAAAVSDVPGRRVSAVSTLAFLEGFLLYSPPAEEGHVLQPVHRNIDVHLFLPAAYDVVKARRENRTGYVTAGPAPAPAPVPAPTTSEEVDLQAEDDRPPQNFWTDPPGYVDDIVWPRYVQDHAWLLLPEGESLRIRSEFPSGETEELIRRVGQGTDVRMDAGVVVAPGQGGKPMTAVLEWAVEEIMRYLLAGN